MKRRILLYGLFFFCVWCLAACASQRILPAPPVSGVPEGQYARIIKLYNPDGHPENTLAGVVHVTGKTTVCTDYPRQEVIGSLNELDDMEKKAFAFFRTYAVQDGDTLLGYVSLPIENRANIWRKQKDADCPIVVQIIVPSSSRGQIDHDGTLRSVTNW